MNEQNLLFPAIRAALVAGDEILKVYHSDEFGVQTKGDLSPLTLADRISNEIILRHLEPTGIPVLSEESVQVPYAMRRSWSRCWIVDPLDGTKEFIKRNGEFTVNIALVVDGKPCMGVIFTPVTDELYFGSLSTGARKNIFQPLATGTIDPEMLVETSTLLPQTGTSTNGFTVVASRSHRNHETEDFIRELEQKHSPIKVLSRGSSLKICMVAEGTADIYPRFAPTMEWDTAAGHAIAKIAGCSFENPETGRELRYNKENLVNPWFIVKRIV